MNFLELFVCMCFEDTWLRATQHNFDFRTKREKTKINFVKALKIN